MGHSWCHRPLFRALIAAGHEVWFAMRSLDGAEAMFAGMNIHLRQAPRNIQNTHNPIVPVCTYAHLLHNVLFHDVGILVRHLDAWQTLIESVQADMLVTDFSPGALLASRDMSLPRVQIGSGFIVPPEVTPFPNMRFWKEVDQARLVKEENQVLATVNAAVATLGMTPLQRLADVFATDAKILTTFKEVDHLAERPASEYSGMVPDSEGYLPVWPAGTGKRIFAYLKPFETLPSLLATLAQKGNPTLVYYAGEITAELERFACDSLHFTNNNLNITETGRQCDLAITHAGHTTAVEFLLAGCPLLLLPLHLEQFLFAQRVVALGAGLNAPLLKPEGMAAKLHLLLTDSRYTQAAESFATRYAHVDGGQAINKLLAILAKTGNDYSRQADAQRQADR